MTYALNEEDEYTGSIDGAERELWCQVILRALADLDGEGKTSGGWAPSAGDALAAAAWFKRNGKDFREVCSLAGVEPGAVRKAAMATIEKRGLLVDQPHAPMTRRIYENSRLKPPRGRAAALLTLNGESHSIREWSRRTGIPSKAIIDRIGRGWSVERAVTTPTVNIITAFGKSMTIPEWSRYTGIPKETLRKRLENGWHVECALTEPRYSTTRHKAEVVMTEKPAAVSVTND